MSWLGAAQGVLLDQRGAMAVEFAGIALPLLLLLGGTIEVSRFVWTRHALQDAASTGARCLGLRIAPCVTDGAMDRTATVALVRRQAEAWAIRIPDAAVLPQASGACNGLVDLAQVQIRHRFTSVLPVLPEAWIEVEACFPVMQSE